LQLYTIAVHVAGRKSLKGKNRTGQYADMVLLNKDYFDLPIDDVKNIPASSPSNGNGLSEGAIRTCPCMLQLFPHGAPKFYGGYQNN